MRSYRIDVQETEHGWLARCPAFDAAVDAAELENAVAGVRLECEDMARRILMDGRSLPADDPIGPDWPEKSIYFRTAVQEEYESENQSPVRRNVSMPAWLDRMLRKNNVDASRLFQEAAIAKLAELERTRGGVPKIASVSELESSCLPGVLDEYFERRNEPGGPARLDPARIMQLVNYIDTMKENVQKLEQATIEGFSSLIQKTKDPDYLLEDGGKEKEDA